MIKYKEDCNWSLSPHVTSHMEHMCQLIICIQHMAELEVSGIVRINSRNILTLTVLRWDSVIMQLKFRSPFKETCYTCIAFGLS